MCTTQWPAWDLRYDLSVNSVLTVFGLLNRIKSTPVQLKVSPCVHKTLSEINFPSSSLSVISPRNFVSWCFLSLHPQYWGLSYVLLPCTLGSGSESRLKLGEDREKHTQRGCSILVPSYEEDSFSPSGFRLLQGPIAAGYSCRDKLLWAEVQESGGWRENEIFLLSRCPFRVLFADDWARMKASPGVLSICTSVCWVQAGIYQRGRKMV